MSFKIPFTQYLMPNGRQVSVDYITEEKELYDRSVRILQAGYVFEIEMLSNGMISATIGDPVNEIDLAHEICSNGPAVNVAINRLITNFNLV